jgi:transcriptional regulator with XRE-family HTH domain
MSTQVEHDLDHRHGAPELTELGKRLEILRIERGVSKQRLARHAGTSRQQLWRVMTGKSELTSSLRDRLATALAIEPMTLVSGHHSAPVVQFEPSLPPAPPLTMTDYLSDVAHLTATLRTLPAGDGGRRLKRALINALEDLSVEAGRALPLDYSEVHRRVLAGEL